MGFIHIYLQSPLTHVFPVGQTVPQLPQWFELLVRFISQPSAYKPLQLPNPVLQVPMEQVLFKQAADPLGIAPHVLLHPPQ
jgi:hypothetical protein